MLQSGSRTTRFLPTAFLCGFLTLSAATLTGCGESSASKPGAPTASAPAKPAAAAPAAKSTTPAAATNPADAAAAKTPSAPAKVGEAPAKAADGSAKVADAPAKVADAPAAKAADAPAAKAPDAPTIKITEAPAKTADKAPAASPDAAKTAASAPAADAAKHSADDGHDHSQHSQEPPKPGSVDPNSDPVDPNSKARLTYGDVGSDTKNFGKVMQGDVLNHKFELSSSGEEDLVIKQAKPTCGCTVAQIAVEQPDGTFAPYNFGQPIAPGRKIEISATLHTQNKRGHAGSRINIFSNDPRGQTQLGLEADVEPFFQINPNVLNFNTLSAKDTKTDKLSISTTKGERVTLTAVKDNMPQGLKIDLNPLDADADGKASRWDLAVTAGPGLIEGNLAYAVPLKSDFPIPGGEKLPNGAMPTYDASATVMARVTGMIAYNPAFVSFGLIKPGQVVSRSVRVTSYDPEFKLAEPKVKVQGREAPAAWEYSKYFSYVVRPVAGENAVDVELRLDGMPDTLNGSFAGVLSIQLGHPEKPELKLPITGVCRGSAVAAPVAGGTPPPSAGGTPVQPPATDAAKQPPH